MSVPFKPHTVTVDLPQEIIDGNVLNGYGDDPQGEVDGMLYPVASGDAYDQFGVTTERGHAFLCDSEQAPKFESGGTVTLGARKFSVKAAPLVFEGFGGCDNATILLEEKD